MRYFLIILIIRGRQPVVAVMFVNTKSEFDIFAAKQFQTAIPRTRETLYKTIAPVKQSDLEFVIPGDIETYKDLNVHLYIRCKLTKLNGTEFDETNHSSIINNFLHSMYSPCSLIFNGV